MATNTLTENAGKTKCMSKAGVGIGGTATKARITAPNGAGVDYLINGLFYHKADTDDVWTLTGTALAASQMVIYNLLLDSSGNASVTQGDIVSSEDVYNGLITVDFPPVPADKCAVGSVLVETSSTGTFTPGTTSLADAQVTDTYFDYEVPPNKGLGDANVTATTFA